MKNIYQKLEIINGIVFIISFTVYHTDKTHLISIQSAAPNVYYQEHIVDTTYLHNFDDDVLESIIKKLVNNVQAEYSTIVDKLTKLGFF